MKKITNSILNFMSTRLGFVLTLLLLYWFKTMWAYSVDFNLDIQGPYQIFLAVINPLPISLLFIGLALYIKRTKLFYSLAFGILKDIQSIYHPDYIDFEYYSHREVFEEMLEFSNLVLSYHNFQETPENMMEILSELTSFSPKLVKVSVMAHNEQDVLDLMNYTRGFKTLNPEQEYVTISMGKVGKISRLTADLTGSSWSYARVGEESAPGQIPLENMRKIRELLNED